jgi:hypothetical protein
MQVHAKDAKKNTTQSKTNLFAFLCEFLCALCVNLHLSKSKIVLTSHFNPLLTLHLRTPLHSRNNPRKWEDAPNFKHQSNFKL